VIPAPSIRKLFQVSKEAIATNPSLNHAYDALTRGDDASAKSAYEQVLSKDPKNADALAGLAVLAQRAGQPQTAADYYLQMLEADPKNAQAISGLVNLPSRMDAGSLESRIKQALVAQPDSAALRGATGVADETDHRQAGRRIRAGSRPRVRAGDADASASSEG